MKTKTLLGATLGICGLFSLSLAQADTDNCVFQGNIVTASQIEKNVQAMGYTFNANFMEKDIKLTNECVYRVKAKDQSDREWVLFFDPSSGNLLAKKAD